MGIREAYARFFALDTADAQADTDRIEWAHAFASLYENKAFARLLKEIEHMTQDQLPITQDVATMAGHIGMQNGRREVLAFIRTETARARRIIAETQATGEDNG